MGLFDKWTLITLSLLRTKLPHMRKYLYEQMGNFERKTSTREVDRTDFKSLNLRSIYSVFIVWSFGIGFSVCFIFYEILTFYFNFC